MPTSTFTYLDQSPPPAKPRCQDGGNDAEDRNDNNTGADATAAPMTRINSILGSYNFWGLAERMDEYGRSPCR